MTKQEFEERTGLTCLNSTFDFINRIYMAAGEQDKDTFCKEWKEAMSENKIVRDFRDGKVTKEELDALSTCEACRRSGAGGCAS